MAFAGGVSASCFGVAFYLENMRSLSLPWYQTTSFWKLWKSTFPDKPKFVSMGYQVNEYKSVYEMLKDIFTEIHPSIWGIVGLNTVVFILWGASKSHSPVLYNMMSRNFVADPRSNRVLPHLLSGFSHQSGTHLAANMLILASCGRAALGFLGPEQFLAVYISSGVVSSVAARFVSYSSKMPLISSLGASHAVLAIFAISSQSFPHALYTFLFFPFVNFTSDELFTFLLLFETMGVVATRVGYRFLNVDHAAHLMGLLFGYSYYHYGIQNIWQNRKKFVSMIPGLVEK